jgi:hypothetical protein
MPFRGIRPAACALAAALLVAPLAAVAATPPKAWDQAAVARLAADLAKAAVAIYDEYYDEQGVGGQSGIGSGDAADGFRLQYKLRRIEEQTGALAGALAAGKGRDETTPLVEDVGELADDLREILQRMFVEIPLQQRVDAARAIWVQLLPYYGLTPPPPPAPAPSKAS